MATTTVNELELSISVISDLHCHYSKREDKRISTHLISDKLRTPIHLHPVEDLNNFIKKNNLKTDILLCPGDITDQMDQQGFISGWDFINEIANAIGAKEVIATIGNHDADSRFIQTTDNIFHVVQGIKKNFPVKKTKLFNELISKGFCFIEKQYYRILVINSTKFHINEKEATQGKVSDSQSEEIRNYIKNNKNNKIQIALCHHSPIDLQLPIPYGSSIFESGQLLINRLIECKFDLLIHGHLHYPKVYSAKSTSGSGSIPILSAGSFSCKENMSGTLNSFHLLNITKSQSGTAKGIIKTIEYLETEGWRFSYSGKPNLPYKTGFGFEGGLNMLPNQIFEIYQRKVNGDSIYLNWNEIESEIPSIQFLNPDEFEKLEIDLQNKHGIEISYSKQRVPTNVAKQYTPDNQ